MVIVKNVLALLFVGLVGLIGGMYGADTSLRKNSFLLPKDQWTCFVSVASNEGYSCVIYRQKEIDLGPFSNRHGNNDKKQGQSISVR